MRLATLLAGLAALVFGSVPAMAGFSVPPNRPGAFAPRDECSSIPGAVEFLAALRSAAARRDTAALLALASKDVRLDFGGGAGRAELRKRLSGTDGAALWDELDAILQLGCAANGQGELTLPWFFAQDLGDVDPFDVMLATGPRVPLYRAAKARGRRAAWLNWQLVMPQASPAAPRGFRRVLVIGSRLSGLVEERHLRSPIDYRLMANRSAGEWRIDMFVAGD
jgi:hypothetical protein